MIGPVDALIARPGWSDQRLVPISPPSMSWRTDGPGSFECEIETRTLGTLGLNITPITNPLKGRWLWWEHPTAGPWGGVITRTEAGPWYTRIVAEQFAVLLRKRRLSANYGPMSISPGSLALLFVSTAERNGDSFLLSGWTAEESGDAIDIEPRGGDLCDDVLPMLADFGYQWRVRANTMDERLFEFRQRVGTDKRATVLLSEGRHVTATRVTGDLWTVANSITGVSGDRDWNQANAYQNEDATSVRTLGRRYEATIAYTGVVSRSTIAPLVKRDLKRLKYPQEIAEVEVVDDDYMFSEFREGDTVTLLSGHANYHGPFEIDVRLLDARRNAITVAGRILTEAA